MNTSTKYPGSPAEENWFSFDREELAVLIRALALVEFEEHQPQALSRMLRSFFEETVTKRHPSTLLPVVDCARVVSDLTRRLIEENAQLRLVVKGKAGQ